MKITITIVSILFIGTSFFLNYRISSLQDELVLSQKESVALKNKLGLLKEEIAGKTYYDLPNNEIVVDHIKCKSIKVVDNKNIKRYSLTTGERSEILQTFYDNSTTERLHLGITEGGVSRIRLFDEVGEPRISSSVTRTDDKSPLVGTTYYHPDEKPAYSTLLIDNYSISQFYDTNGQVRIRSGCSNMFGFYALFDKNGVERMEINTDPNSNASIVYMDNNNRSRIKLTQSVEGNAGLYLFDNYGTYRQGIGINYENLAFIESTNNNKKVMFGSYTYYNGTNKTYIYRSPGKKLWDAWSDIMTAVGSLSLFK